MLQSSFDSTELSTTRLRNLESEKPDKVLLQVLTVSVTWSLHLKWLSRDSRYIPRIFAIGTCSSWVPSKYIFIFKSCKLCGCAICGVEIIIDLVFSRFATRWERADRTCRSLEVLLKVSKPDTKLSGFECRYKDVSSVYCILFRLEGNELARSFT